MPIFRKILDFLLYIAIVTAMMCVAIFWLPRNDAIIVSLVVFLISSWMIIHVSISSFQKDLLQQGSYFKISHKIFSPFALIMSFCVLCYLLYQVNAGMFLTSGKPLLTDFFLFSIDNVLRVVLWDVPEIYGLAVTPMSHNFEDPLISSLVLVFRTMIGLSLIKMLIALIRSR